MNGENPTPQPLPQREAFAPDQPSLEPAVKRSGGLSLLFLSLFLLALLLMALSPNPFVRGRSRGTLTACKSNLKNLGTALEMYAEDHHARYPSRLDLLTPNYLKTIPECPRAEVRKHDLWNRLTGNGEKAVYRVSFGLNAPLNTGNYPDYYYIECHGENHREVSVTGHYPAYNGIQGLIERAP